MNRNGWRMIGSACCGPPGAIVIYDTTPAGSNHAAFSMGGGLISQHNPYRCRLLPRLSLFFLKSFRSPFLSVCPFLSGP